MECVSDIPTHRFMHWHWVMQRCIYLFMLVHHQRALSGFVCSVGLLCQQLGRLCMGENVFHTSRLSRSALIVLRARSIQCMCVCVSSVSTRTWNGVYCARYKLDNFPQRRMYWFSLAYKRKAIRGWWVRERETQPYVFLWGRQRESERAIRRAIHPGSDTYSSCSPRDDVMLLLVFATQHPGETAALGRVSSFNNIKARIPPSRAAQCCQHEWDFWRIRSLSRRDSNQG